MHITDGIFKFRCNSRGFTKNFKCLNLSCDYEIHTCDTMTIVCEKTNTSILKKCVNFFVVSFQGKINLNALKLLTYSCIQS